MEGKNNHPSLPSNYVTLAQLQERWLQQKEKEKQLQEKKLLEEQQQQQQKQNQQITKPPQHNPREYRQGKRPKALQQTWRAMSAPAAVKRSLAKSRPKNSNVLERNRVSAEVNRETNETVEAKAEIGDGNDGQDGRKKKSKKNKKKVKRKPRAEDATESTTVESKEVSNSDFKRIVENTETEIEQNGSNSISMNSENEKQNSKVKTNGSSRGYQRNKGGRNYRNGRTDKHIEKLAEDVAKSVMLGNKEAVNSNVELVDDKGETKVELIGSKSDNLMSEVEQKLGNIAMNSENEKLNIVVKTRDSSHGSRRNCGGDNYSTGRYGRVDKERKKLAANVAQSTKVGNKEVVNSDAHRVDDDKRETQIKLNGSKSDNLVSEVVPNGRVRTYDGYRGFQRNNGGRNYRTGPYGGGIHAHEVQRWKVDQKIWVRKSEDFNGNVDNNEITSK